MSERLEKYGFLVATIIQFSAAVWWASALTETVDRQDAITEQLDVKVEKLTEKVVRLEERLIAFERNMEKNSSVLLRIEDRLNARN